MDDETVRVRAIAGGRVQGVAYRFFAEKAAARRGVSGWVRNLPDGRVEALAEGPGPAVEAFLEDCFNTLRDDLRLLAEGPGPAVADFLTELRSGPRLARVDSFEVRRETATGEFGDFRIVFTAGD